MGFFGKRKQQEDPKDAEVPPPIVPAQKLNEKQAQQKDIAKSNEKNNHAEITAADLKVMMKKKSHVAPMPEETEPAAKQAEQTEEQYWYARRPKDSNSIYSLEVDCVRRKQEELLRLYPSAKQKIINAISNVNGIKMIKPERAKQLLQADKMLAQYANKAENMPFDEQKNMRKVLVESADGEQSDYESEAEGELTTIEDAAEPSISRQEIKLEQKKTRIFKYLTVQDKNVSLPTQRPAVKDKSLGPMTLFIEIDDVFVHTFLCDENFGYMANPTAKDPEHEFLIEEWKQPVLVYERDYMHDFLTYLKDVKPEVETILYTTGQAMYTDQLLRIIDDERQIFDHVLYQNACYNFVKKDEDIHFFIKDISRFKNRNIKRSVLADPKPLNFLMTPENGLPVSPYEANSYTHEKDDYLLGLIEELEELRKLKDVRPYLEKNYKVRQNLKGSKLI